MTLAQVAAVVAITMTVTGALGGAIMSWKSKGIDATKVVFEAQSKIVDIYKEDNQGLRAALVDVQTRLRAAEDRERETKAEVAALKQEVIRCEADKDRLRVELDELRREVRGERGPRT